MLIICLILFNHVYRMFETAISTIDTVSTAGKEGDMEIPHGRVQVYSRALGGCRLLPDRKVAKALAAPQQLHLCGLRFPKPLKPKMSYQTIKAININIHKLISVIDFRRFLTLAKHKLPKLQLQYPHTIGD